MQTDDRARADLAWFEAMSEGMQPRPFAIYELAKKGGEVVRGEICAWGVDLNLRRASDYDGPGAIFAFPGGMLGDADSAEDALEMFAVIRSVRLVWL